MQADVGKAAVVRARFTGFPRERNEAVFGLEADGEILVNSFKQPILEKQGFL